MSRAAVYEKVRIGIEDDAAYGTPVPANLIYQEFTLQATPVVPRKMIRSRGRARPVGVASAGKEHTEFTLEADAAYEGTALLLSSLLCRPTSTVPVAGVAALSFKPIADGKNVMNTFTFEAGSNEGNCKIPGCYINDLTLSFSHEAVTLKSGGIGKRYDEFVTFSSATPTEVNLVAVDGDTFNVWVSDTFAGISAGGAQLADTTTVEIEFGGRRNFRKTLDRREGSISATVEKAPDAKVTLTLNQDNVQGQAMMNRLRSKELFWIKVESIAVSPIITGQYYKMSWMIPVAAVDSKRNENDDALDGVYEMEMIYSSEGSFNSYCECVINLPTAEGARLATEGTPDTTYNKTIQAGYDRAVALTGTTAQVVV